MSDAEKSFHRQLDGYMRDEIEKILRKDPTYFSKRLIANDILSSYIKGVMPQQRWEHIQCRDIQNGNIRAVNKLMDEVVKYNRFAIAFLKSLKANGCKDVAQELIKGLSIDSLSHCDDADFIRELSGSGRPPPPSPPPPYDDSNISDHLADQQQMLSMYNSLRNQSEAPPSSFMTKPVSNTSPEVGRIPSPVNPDYPDMNIHSSTITTDNNPPGDDEPSDYVENDLNRRSLLRGGSPQPVTLQETTNIFSETGNANSMPEEQVSQHNLIHTRFPAGDVQSVLSDVPLSEVQCSVDGSGENVPVTSASDLRPSEVCVSADDSVGDGPITMVQNFRVPGERSGEYSSTRYDALIPTARCDATRSPGTPNADNEQAFGDDSSTTLPKEVVQPQQPAQVADDLTESANPSLLSTELNSQSTIRKSADDMSQYDATLTTHGIVDEPPAEDLESQLKPTNVVPAAKIDDVSEQSVVNHEAKDKAASPENPTYGDKVEDDSKADKDSSPLAGVPVPTVVVTCLASVCLTLFLLKKTS